MDGVNQCICEKISSGEIDYHVPTDLTLMQDFTPRPRNRTLHKTSTSGGSPSLSLVTTVKNYLQSIVLFPLRFILSSPSTESAPNATITSNDVPLNETSTEIIEQENINTLNSTDSLQCTNSSLSDSSAANDTNVFNQTEHGPFPFVTEDNWNLHMMPFIEPQFLNIRTFQLKGIGAPVDHLAILWCYQFVSTVLDGMRQLSVRDDSHPNDGFNILLNAFPLKPEYQIDYNESAMLNGRNVLPLERFLARDDLSKKWYQAGLHELETFQTMLDGGRFSTVALYFVTHKGVYVLSWYLAIAILLLTVPLMRSLCKHPISEISFLDPLSNYNMLQPWVHLNLDILFGFIPAFLQTWLPREFSRMAVAVLISAPAIAISYCLFALCFQQWNPLSLSARLVFAYLAYSSALVLRGFFVSALYSIHLIAATVVGILRTVLRYTIYCRPVRRFIRSSVKFVKVVIERKTGIKEGQAVVGAVVTLTISLVATLWVSGMDRINGPTMHLGYVAYSISVIAIVSYMAALVGIVFSLLLPPYRDSDSSQYFHFVDFSLLYLPVLFLGRPTFLYSVHMVIGNPGYAAYTHHSTPDLSALFGPEQIHYCIFMTAIALHIWLARFKRYSTY